MIFLLLLMVAAFSIAGSAAFFSVTGLASTFHGTYWSTVIMGGSLEFGKLVATSYLYRYWKETHLLLKSILLILITALMILTSMGIFGYLSTGYMSDSIPLKQTEQRVVLLEAEKTRLIDRKKQIDDQIASLPSNTSRGRLALMKGFKDEQNQLTARVGVLETEEIDLKTKVILSEAHIGPIVYIAKALKLDTDDATKYLIYLIIFVFDPMALSLTLALNIAVKLREKSTINEILPDIVTEEPIIEEPIIEEPIVLELEIIEESNIDHILEDLSFEEEDTWVLADGSEIKTMDISEHIPATKTVREYRTELENMISNFHYYKSRIDGGEILSQDENWKYLSIRDTLQKQGFNMYV